MLNQNYAPADASGAGITPVTLPNVYSSPSVYQRSQPIIENNGHFLSAVHFVVSSEDQQWLFQNWFEIIF